MLQQRLRRGRRRCRGRRCRTRRRRSGCSPAVARGALRDQELDDRLRHRHTRGFVIAGSPRAATNAVDFVQRRHEVGAAVAGHDDRAAGVAHAGRALERPALQVSVEKSAGERVAGAEHIQHLDRKRCDIAAAADRRVDSVDRARRASTRAPRCRPSSSVAAPCVSVIRSPSRPQALLRCRPRASPIGAACRICVGECRRLVPLIGAVIDVHDDRRRRPRGRPRRRASVAARAGS